MIIFHEGLPRSGKSYSAIKDHLIPAIRESRRVFCSIEGLNYEKISDVAGVPLETVRKNLFQLTNDDFRPENIAKLFRRYEMEDQFDDEGKSLSLLKDSLIFIDEIQDIYPGGKKPLPEGAISFIAQHGHYGMDIIILSQTFRGVHPEWRRKTQTRYQFVKRTAIGKPDSFKWTALEGQGEEKFEKISSGVADYDPLYFGLYKSHKDGTA